MRARGWRRPRTSARQRGPRPPSRRRQSRSTWARGTRRPRPPGSAPPRPAPSPTRVSSPSPWTGGILGLGARELGFSLTLYLFLSLSGCGGV